MAVNHYCHKCKRTYKATKRKCQACQIDLTKYRVRVVNLDGKQVSKVTASLSEAKKLEVTLKNSHSKSLLSFDSIFTKEYLSYASKYKRSWKDDEQRYIKHIKPSLGDLRLDEIQPNRIQAILDSMISYAPATRRQVLQLISRVYNWSKKQGIYRGHNPCVPIEIPKFDNRVSRFLSEDELKRLFGVLEAWPNERASSIVKFALFSGRRRGEILNLTWDDVDIGRGFITLRQAKSGLIQSFPLSETCYRIIKRALELRISNYVFPSNTGGHYHNTFKGTWRAIRDKAELKNFRFHDLRHSYASFMASSGKVDIYTLQNLLGHQTLAMTQRYAHLFPEHLRKAVRVADEVIK